MNSLWPRNTGSITHLQCVSMYLYIPQKYCFPPDLRCVQCSRENPGRLKSADKNTATYYVQSTSTKTQRQSTLKFKTYCVTVGCRTEEKGVGLSRGRNDHSDRSRRGDRGAQRCRFSLHKRSLPHFFWWVSTPFHI